MNFESRMIELNLAYEMLETDLTTEEYASWKRTIETIEKELDLC